MAAQSAGSHNVDVRELFNMLESNDINVSNDITKLVQENLSSTKEAWLVCSLVDYYYISQSERTLQIIKDVREPHDKHLVDKLNEGLKSVEHRLPAMKILLSLACKQPIWVHKLVTHQIFHAIIKTLKTETDIPVVMTGVMTLTVLLPSVPALIGNQLTEIFTIFSRLIAFNERKPGNVPDVFLLHLQVALYSLFHRLYGMFPYNFLTFLRHHYNKKDNTKVFDEFVKPMLDRVRLHPHLITSSRDHELSSKRWRQMEAQDVVIECAKMSLDMTEGMWEELTCPIISPHHMVFQPSAKKPSLKLFTPEQDGTLLNPTHQLNPELSPPCLTTGTDGMGLWSPSVVVGLSTPPPSQQTTPHSNSYHETSRYIYGNTPSETPPVDTPRVTSPNNDDLDKSFSRTSSRSLLTAKGSELKRLSTGSTVSAKACGAASVTDGKPTSVPPSPLRAEFTSDPPQGPGIFKPVRLPIRELKFDAITEGQQPLDQERTELTKESGESERPDLMESFDLMDSLPRVMDTLARQIENPDNDDDNDDDQEVSDLTSHTTTLTAESVQMFMRKVNRIRFNSLTATNSISEQQKFGARSRSCPHLPKIDSLESEGDETDSVSRSASATLKTMASPRTNDKLSPLQDQTIPAESCPKLTSTNCLKLLVDKTTGSDLLTRTMKKEKTVPSCPVMSPGAGQEQSPDVSSKVLPNMYIDMMRTMLQPGSLLLCQKCNQSNSDGSPLTALGSAGMPTSFSPPELLDRHLRLGGEVHAKQLSKIPITSHDSISWTHFGGMPPADEVNILRGQIFMIQNQLMYERHKRELHAKKNRRLLRKIANAKAVEEQNNAMSDQLSQYEREIQNMQFSLHLLQEENRRYKESQESNEYESKVQMRSCLAENEDLKSAKSELTTLLVRQREEQDLLKQRLQETESKLFKSDKEKCHLQEEVQFTQKLKEQVFTLHKEVLLMGELHQHYQEQINSARIHSKTKHEQDLHVMSQTAEITALKKALKSVTLTGEASQARVNQLEATVKTKDIALVEIKQSLADVITNHQEELKSIDEKYQCMLKVNQQLEGKILRLYSQVDELSRPRQTKESPDLTVSKEESPTRERTGSDPTIVTNVSKTPLCKMTSVPTYCEMKDHRSDMLAAGSSHVKHQPRNVSPLTTHSQSVGGDIIVPPNMTRTMECDNGSVSSRESGMFAPHRSVYSEGEDHSLSSRGSNLLDSGYST